MTPFYIDVQTLLASATGGDMPPRLIWASADGFLPIADVVILGMHERILSRFLLEERDGEGTFRNDAQQPDLKQSWTSLITV